MVSLDDNARGHKHARIQQYRKDRCALLDASMSFNLLRTQVGDINGVKLKFIDMDFMFYLFNEILLPF